MTHAHVAVVIVGYRNVDDIVCCLAALANSSHSDFEIVICENGGPAAYADLIEAIADRLPGGQSVTILQAPGNLGYAGGVNVCLRSSPDADAWWVLNPDTEPHPEAMAALLKRLGAGGCDAVGGTLYLPNRKVQSYGGRWRPWLAHSESIGFGRDLEAPVDCARVERQLNYLSGASMMAGRRFVESAGLMREDYFLYCEEVEWCLRAVAGGMKLGFAPAARVLHRQGTTTGSAHNVAQRSRLAIYLGERNRMLLTRDRFALRMPVVALASLATIVLHYGRRGAMIQMFHAFSGWWAGIHGRRGAQSWLSSESPTTSAIEPST